jgi:hypothetical protein
MEKGLAGGLYSNAKLGFLNVKFLESFLLFFISKTTLVLAICHENLCC